MRRDQCLFASQRVSCAVPYPPHWVWTNFGRDTQLIKAIGAAGRRVADGVRLADVDGDGWLDIATEEGGLSKSIRVILGSGSTWRNPHLILAILGGLSPRPADAAEAV